MGGLLLQAGEEVGAVTFLVIMLADVLVGGASAEHPVDQARQLVRKRFDRPRRIHPRAQPAAKGSERALALDRRLRADVQNL